MTTDSQGILRVEVKYASHRQCFSMYSMHNEIIVSLNITDTQCY